MTVVGDDLFVPNAITGAVYRVNLHTHAMPNSADVSVFASDAGPRGVVVDPTSHLAFVTRTWANSVDVFDPKSMRLIKQIPVAKGRRGRGQADLGARPFPRSARWDGERVGRRVSEH
jgi:DNA-binding beta-propeller fold protein YncE